MSTSGNEMIATLSKLMDGDKKIEKTASVVKTADPQAEAFYNLLSVKLKEKKDRYASNRKVIMWIGAYESEILAVKDGLTVELAKAKNKAPTVKDVEEPGTSAMVSIWEIIDSAVNQAASSVPAQTQKAVDSVVASILTKLTKLAEALDDAGDVQAADMVDNTMKSIVEQSCMDCADARDSKPSLMFDDPEDVTEVFEEEEPVTGREEGMGTRQPKIHPGYEGEFLDPAFKDAPEGLEWAGYEMTEDNMDRLLSDPKTRDMLKRKLGL